MEFWKKKLFGIPYLYIALLFVGVLAFYAWKMKGQSVVPSTDATDPSSDTITEDPGDYSQFATDGTVTVSQPGVPSIVTPVTVNTNDKWARDGAAWLASKGLATQDGAFAALNKYLNGDQLSIQEGKLRDAWISQNGLPPESYTPGGTQAAPPMAAARQGNPPLVHKVKGGADASYGGLEGLYYGHGQDGINFLSAHNMQLPAANGALAVGTAVKIPTYEYRTYIVPKGVQMNAAQIAAKNGASTEFISRLNQAPGNYVWGPGRAVRVR